MESATKTGNPLKIGDVFVGLRDPRQAKKVEHDLVELLVIAVCGVLAGADGFVEIEEWAKEKRDWFQRYLRLEHGIPSHDTFGRVFAAIDAQAFAEAFRRWVSSVVPPLGEDEVVAIDDKTSRRTGKIDATPLHLVSAFAAGAGVVLGQRASAEKSNEKTAIPELLATLALEGCIVTIDAMGTQPSIAQAIRDRKADYVLSAPMCRSRPGSIAPIINWLLCAVGDTEWSLLGIETKMGQIFRSNPLICLARPTRFERVTPAFGVP